MTKAGHTPKLGGLEFGRGIAALAVVMHHAGQASDAFTSQDHGRWLNLGALGVDFFFVLSGFIIYHVHHRDPRTLGGARRYFIKRLRRIFVPYLPVVLALMASYTLMPSLSQGGREWGVLTSLTLLPSSLPPALSVAWTLVFEMMFYILFLTFFLTRFFWWGVSFWVAMTIGLAVNGWGDGNEFPFLKTLLNPLTLEFVAGMIAAVLFSKLQPSVWPLALAIGVICVGSFLWHENDTSHRVLFGLGLTPLVVGIALAEARFRYRLPNYTLLLGAASYSIYLVHNPIASLAARVFRRFDSWPLTFTACVMGGVILGILYHLILEKPALRVFSSRNVAHASQIVTFPDE